MKENKAMFWIGILMIVVTAIVLLTFEGDATWTTIIGFLGILFIGVSRYRPLVKMLK
tara:strand:+ start:606 stop:776 length:171 start_codon:yes stop_codon:yes gene_type:complete